MDSVNNVSVKQVACGLNYPWGIAVLPNGDALVSERSGGVKLFHAGRLARSAIEGSPRTTASFMGGQLDIALDPDFSANRRVFFTYVTGSAPPPAITGLPGKLRLTVASAIFRNGKFSDHKVLVETAPPIPDDHHFGGRIAFLPDGDLLVTTGDSYDTPIVAQQDKTLLGKILRIEPSGHVSVYAKGFRNSQGIVVGPDGQIFAVDHGPVGGDELNLIEAGANYGWPVATNGKHEGKYKQASSPTARSVFRDPVYAWPAPFAPSGIAIYDGKMFPEWRGELLVAALAGKRIDRLDISGPTIRHTGTLLAEHGARIRDVAVAADGSILALTDQDNGCVLRLSKQY